MILNINQLRAFYTAAKHKSVSEAANQLMVTPPAVTMQVKQLEETLGIRLMFRDKNSIRLTEVGETVFKKSKVIFGRITEMENFLEDISRAKSGVLRIGCPPTPAKYVMPRLISMFKKTYPEIRIVLEQGASSNLVKSIERHQSELAVVRCRPDEKRLKVKLFGTEELVLVAAFESRIVATEEISVTNLPDIPLIMPQEGSATRRVVLEYLGRFRITPFVVMESASADLIKELVRQDNGACFLVRSAVQHELKINTLKEVRVLEGAPRIQYGIGYLQRKTLSPAAWAFLRLLDRVGDILPTIE
jgi:DNA-binding transcriptional LysR family regulator